MDKNGRTQDGFKRTARSRMLLGILPRLCSPALLLTASRANRAATLLAGAGSLRPMSSSSPPSPYTTLKERATCKREIKKSKFIAIAAPISDERSAHSFLSEVFWRYRAGNWRIGQGLCWCCFRMPQRCCNFCSETQSSNWYGDSI
ncbi:hypothetical protein COCNU_05G005090 [Cocos nucifera]|uniref:Uncharacterized protein n=1 Tax=Cocos nucifera TaxID=13894 RepID=A0A8K0N1G6_COCNU|nr:hypothetical protein COCNU_05G005090 [Cocos nucifera]